MWSFWTIIFLIQSSTSFLQGSASNKGFSRKMIHTLLKMIQEVQFPGQKCDLVVIDNAISADEVPIISVAKNGYELPDIQSFLLEHSKCILVITDYDNAESLRRVDDITAQKANSFIIAIGTHELKDYMTKRWRAFVYVQKSKINNGINEEAYFIWTRCPDGSTYMSDLWTEQKEFTLQNANPISKCLHAFSGRTFTIEYLPVPPFILGPKELGGSLRGTDFLIVQELAKKLQFKPIFVPRSIIITNHSSADSYSLIKLNRLLGVGGTAITYEDMPFLDYTTPTYIFHQKIAARNPQQKSSYNNILKTFDGLVWGSALISVIAVCATFVAIFFVYKAMQPLIPGLRKPQLVHHALDWVDFLSLPFSKSSEIIPILQNYKSSSGLLLLVFWSIFIMFMMFFFNSNLLANLVQKDYEKPLRTLQDVLDRNKPVYIPDAQAAFDYIMAAKSDIPMSPIAIQISKMAHKYNGYYDIIKSGGRLPPKARDDVMNNGAMYACTEPWILYEYLQSKSFGYPHITITEEDLGLYLAAFNVKKHSTFKNDIDMLILRLNDFGILDKFLYDPIPLEATIKWRPPKNQDLEPLNIKQVLTILLLMAAAWVISTLIFAVERANYIIFPHWKMF